jgi:predicted DNA-binding protein (UPF0251 family)
VPRPKKCRRVCCDPEHSVFKPQGVPLDELEIVDLDLDELEALRLADLDGLPQKDAAARMEISQPTFSRILATGRNKVAICLTQGRALRMKKNGSGLIRSGDDSPCPSKSKGRS